MRRSLAGAAVLLLGAVLVVQLHGQVPAGATYAGNRLCLACHKGTNAELVAGYQQTAHFKAMQAASDAAIVADFAGAPFGKDQVKWVLGVGRHEQAYLDGDLKVLPGIWSVTDKKWVPQEAVDGATQCVGCHTTGFDPAAKTWKELGVGCERCHGPGSVHNTAKREERKTTILNPATLDPALQAAACGQCHSHGKSKDGQYAYPHGYVPGTDLAAVFDDGKPTAPGRNQQYSELLQSPAHWDAGVVCEKCHDPHGNTQLEYQLRMPINDTCLQCHAAAVKSLAEHVAAKGKTAPADATCATCHMPDARHLFDKTIVP